jgi:hypothetical protein
MKHKKKSINWDRVAWTPFEEATFGADYPTGLEQPSRVFLNSRYQVSAFEGQAPEPFGRYVHLSIKARDKSARHDWRDMQRIKNEIVGPEHEAVELFPAESRLVDGANQYHLYVFASLRLPFGFASRLVSDGYWRGSVQRPFEVRPADCLGPADMDALLAKAQEDA